MCFAAYAEGKHQLPFAISASAMRSSTPTPLTSKTGSHKRACHRSGTTLIRNTRSTWMYPGFFFVVVGVFFCSSRAVSVSAHHCRAEGADLASKLPSSQSNRAFMGCHGSNAVPNTHTHTQSHTSALLDNLETILSGPGSERSPR